MTYTDFLASPWSNPHPKYRDSPFSLFPAPEYANSEVLIAGLYRTIGASGIAERQVPARGRELDQRIARMRDR